MEGRIKRKIKEKKMSLPRVGLIKTGKKTDKGHPTSVDYFIPKGKYENLFKTAYGDKPQTIQIVFLEDDPSSVCFERYEYRNNEGKLVGRGDGEIFEIFNETTFEYEPFSNTDYPNLMEKVHTKHKSKKGWEVILTLKFILPKVRGIVGHWEFSTKGEASSIPQIVDMFDAMIESNGFVKGVIFDLSVQFAKSQKPNSKSRYPVVSLVPNESDENREIVQGSMLNLDSQRQLNG